MIVETVARETGVPFDDIVGDGRDLRAVVARRVCYRRMRDQGVSLPEIGRLMQRHHTTVLHSLRGHR